MGTVRSIYAVHAYLGTVLVYLPALAGASSFVWFPPIMTLAGTGDGRTTLESSRMAPSVCSFPSCTCSPVSH